MTPVVEAQELRKLFAAGEPVVAVSGVSVSVDVGEMVALMGPSGSGKTTLLSLLGLLDRPTAGEVLFEGSPTNHLPDQDRTRLRGARIGFVFQSFYLVNYLTAVENIESALRFKGLSPRERRDRSMEALDDVGLTHRALHRPAELSGGEQQRIAIARALVPGPALVLADEPTGNLDLAASEGILDLLAGFAVAGAVVTATHDPFVADRCTRTLNLQDGSLCPD